MSLFKNPRFMIPLILISAIALLIFFWSRDISHRAEEKGQLTEQNRSLKNDLQILEGDKASNEKAQVVVTQKKEQLQTQVTKTKQELGKKESVIAETVTDEQQKSQQLSLVRMQSVWQTFCLVEPNNAQCQQQSPAEATTPQKETATKVQNR